MRGKKSTAVRWGKFTLKEKKKKKKENQPHSSVCEIIAHFKRWPTEPMNMSELSNINVLAEKITQLLLRNKTAWEASLF